MKESGFSKQVLFYVISGFALIIVFLWLDELFDLPHNLLGGIVSPVNIPESAIESLFVIILGVIVVFYLRKVLNKWTSEVIRRKNAEKELLKYSGNLEALVKEKTEKLEKEHYNLAKAEAKRHSLELQLLQSQKMEAIGYLARNMSHEFNNILGIMMGFTEILIKGRQINDKEKEYLEEIYRQGENASELIKNISVFARAKNQVFLPIMLSDFLGRIIKLIQVVLPKTIEIRQNIKKNCRPIFGDETQIQQVIINLCNNAQYSMQENGGILEISLEEVEYCIDKSKVSETSKPNAYLRISISDTGSGMTDEVKKHLFEPFFTTKEVGKGSGLGLSVVQSIMKNHKGAVTVESVLGKGTTFHLYFPNS